MLNSALLRKLQKYEAATVKLIDEMKETQYKVDTRKSAEATNDCVLSAIATLEVTHSFLTSAIKHCPSNKAP